MQQGQFGTTAAEGRLIRPGDELVVTRLDRLAVSIAHTPVLPPFQNFKLGTLV